MRWFPYFLTLLLLMVSSSSHAQDEKTLSFSLQQATDYALEHNYNTRNARLDADINNKLAYERISEGLPKLSLDVIYQNNIDLPTTIIPGDFVGAPGEDFEVEFGTKHNVNVDFLATQLIIDGRYFIGLRANKTLKVISKEQVNLSEEDLKNNVAKAYYGVLVSQRAIDIVEKNLTTINQLLNETRELYKSGFAEELDVNRLELQLSNMESTKKKAMLQVELNKSILKYQMGMEHTVDITLTDDLESLLAGQENYSEAPFDATTRTEYQLLNHRLSMRIYDAKQVAIGYFPSISAFAGYGFSAQRQTFNIFDFNQSWYRSAYWGLEFKVPIFDSFKKGSIYQQKKLDQLKIRNQMAEFELQANLEVIQKRNNYETALEEYNNQQENLELAEKIYNKVQIMYKEGLGSSLELATAESDLAETQSNYINAMFDLLVAQSDLKKALGNY